MHGKTQLTGPFVQIGVLPSGTVKAGLSRNQPGQLVMDPTTFVMTLGRPNGAGPSVILMTPLNPIKNDTDGDWVRRVGGFNYAVDAGTHKVRIRCEVISVLDRLNLADGVPVTIGLGPDVASCSPTFGSVIMPATAAVTGSGIVAQVVPDDTTGVVDVTFNCVNAGTKIVTLTVGTSVMTVRLPVA